MISAILLDLGNVVLEVDFRRTFHHWARSANVDVMQLHERWSLDDAYRAHETGAITFTEYTDALAERLGISLSLGAWLSGWNELFVGPYPHVQQRLAALHGRIPLYAFTNTNKTHEQEWRKRFGHALDHFEEIFVSSTIGMRKPDTSAYTWVADAMSLQPDQILFVDDTAENVDGARAAGLEVEWVNNEADVLQALSRF